MKETIDLKAEVEKIWSEPNLEPIPEYLRERGSCYCNDVFRDGVKILIFGFNPSFRSDASNGPCSFSFETLMEKPDSNYWSGISKLLADSTTNTAYWDLFSYRATAQETLRDSFLKPLDNIPCNFVIEHIQLAQKIAETVKPKLIIVENHEAWAYFGKYFSNEYCAKATGWRWMNYMYSSPEQFQFKYSEVRRIVGIHTGNPPDTNVSGLTSTNLVGTKILFMNYIGWYDRKKWEVYRPTPDCIAKLLE